jgi:hypothetical protein
MFNALRIFCWLISLISTLSFAITISMYLSFHWLDLLLLWSLTITFNLFCVQRLIYIAWEESL